MWLYTHEFIKVRHHPNQFLSQKQSGSGDIMILDSYLISQDQVIKGSYNFMCNNSLKKVTILASLVVIATLVVEE